MAEAPITFVLENLKELVRYNANLVMGVEKEINTLAQELERVRDLLYAPQIRTEEVGEEIGKEWLLRLERTCYEMEDVLDECYALLKLRKDDRDRDHDHESEEEEAAAAAPPPEQKVRSLIPSSSFMFFKNIALRRGIANKIIDVKQRLEVVFKEKDRFDFAILPDQSWRHPVPDFAGLKLVRGRDSDRDILVTKLTGRSKGSGVQVVSVVGVGGLGKTTLAQLVFNDTRVQQSFVVRIWVCVSGPFDLVTIARGILESMGSGSSSNTNQLDVLLRDVKECISGKRFLLVLDDVLTEDFKEWEPLKNSIECGKAGSKVLVTTRNQKVAEIMDSMDDGIHHLGELTNEECWRLLCDEAFSGRNKDKSEAFKEISEGIAKKCKGLPLAAQVLGSLLRCKSRLKDWLKVLNTELWQLEEAARVIFPCLRLSYDKFSPMIKRCFSYCTVFPKGCEIYVEDLIGYWMALGFLGSSTSDMELKGRYCYDVLAKNSLFKEGLDGQRKSCKIPDIVHDFAQYLMKGGRVEVGGSNNSTCGTCDPLLISTVNEFYSLFFVDFDDAPQSLCKNCLKHLRVLSMPTDYGLLNFPQGLKPLIHLRWLKLDGKNLSVDDLKIIFQLYNLQTLLLKNCKLEVIPSEIGNLIQLRCLDLSFNDGLKELPESVGGLKELRTLDVRNCPRLIRLPEEVHRLINLRHLHNDLTFGVNGLSSLGLLKNMKYLSGTLRLKIRVADDDLEDLVEAAREAKLREKKHVERLVMEFEDEMKKEEGSSQQRSDLINALEPQPDLRSLEIWSYNGPNLPAWILSLNNLRKIHIFNCDCISSLLPLAKLPCLEEIEMFSMHGLQSVGREFLGMTTPIGGGDIQPASNSTVAFPKLKKLAFRRCPNWKRWEDITAEEEESAAVSLMPCLTHLTLRICTDLTELPHRLLRKVSTLEVLDLSYSEKLQKRYGDMGDSLGISIIQNPYLQRRASMG